jgi:DNA-binding transcriptional LysR family regulator
VQARLKVARHELLAAREAARAPEVLPLRIGVLPLAMLELVPAAIARLRARLPGVRISLTEGTVTLLWAMLARGELDALVGRLPAVTESAPLPAGIVHWQVGQERLVLCCAGGHAMARRRAVALAALREQDWVVPPEGSYTRLLFDQLFVRAGLVPPVPMVTSLSFHSSLRLADKAGMLAVVPESAARRYAKALDLKVLAVPWVQGDASVILACRESGLANPAVAGLRASFMPPVAARRGKK